MKHLVNKWTKQYIKIKNTLEDETLEATKAAYLKGVRNMLSFNISMLGGCVYDSYNSYRYVEGYNENNIYVYSTSVSNKIMKFGSCPVHKEHFVLTLKEGVYKFIPHIYDRVEGVLTESDVESEIAKSTNINPEVLLQEMLDYRVTSDFPKIYEFKDKEVFYNYLKDNNFIEW